MILRSKTKELLQTRALTEKQLTNSALNISELEAGSRILKSKPRRIVLEMTSACNIKCVMCGRDEAEFNQTYLDINILEFIAPILDEVEEVALFGWGEPTLHPKFVDFLSFLSRYPVRKYFVTNGTRLDKIADAIFKYNVDLIGISLDGATKATNDRIRVGADFDKIIENIKILKTIQQDNGVSAPYINFVFTAMRSNIHELSSLVELAASLGAEEVKVVYLTVFSKELLSESLIDSQALVSKYFDEATELSAKLGIKLKLPYIQGEDVGKNLPHKDCFVGWRDLFLASDGTARPCQSTSMKFSKISEFDNVLELWNSRQIQEFRGSVNDATKMPIECMKCYQSSHANWNQPHAFIQVNNCFAPKWEK